MAIGCWAIVGCKDKGTTGNTDVPVVKPDDPQDPPIVPPQDTTVVSGLVPSLTLKDEEISTFKFENYFSITENGESLPVISSCIDLTNLPLDEGEGEVICTFNGFSASIGVTVIPTIYEVRLETTEITLNTDFVNGYDFLSYFSLTRDGESADITLDMITTDVKAEAGVYTYIVSKKSSSATLTITVTDKHDIVIYSAFGEMSLYEAEIGDYDFATLFLLYIDGNRKSIGEGTLDDSAKADKKAGDNFDVLFYIIDQEERIEKKVKINVVEEEEWQVTTRNITIYSNGTSVDLTTLFDITRGEERYNITPDMIEGTIDYSVVGNNTITLNFGGAQYTANVEVTRGVVIGYPNGNKIKIVKGTNQSKYDFSKDFGVVINGTRFYFLSDYIDVTQVDFASLGSYSATIKIPYNDKKLSLSGVNFDYIEGAITYEVVANDYLLSLAKDYVLLPSGTTSYNPYTNLSLTINGKKQSFTNNPAYVDVISCYAEVVSLPLDFASPSEQEVKIAVYVNSPQDEPIYATFTVRIEADIVINSLDKIIFEGDELYPHDLFEIIDCGEQITAKEEDITGILNLDKAGLYTLTLNYKGIKKSSTVTVYDSSILGAYHTTLKSIGSESDYDEEGYEVGGSSSATLKDMYVNSLNNIKVNGTKASVLSANSEKMVIKLGSNEYDLYFDNGIAILDPENSIRLGFSNYKRPMVYFNEKYWTIGRTITINYGSEHVLSNNFATYSIDTFELISAIDGSKKWYALMIDLVEKTSNDTVYSVGWGECSYNVGFLGTSAEQGVLTFAGKDYIFNMTNTAVGKIDRSSSDVKKYVNREFYGEYQSKTAKLVFDQYQNVSFLVDGKTVVPSITSNDMATMINGGFDYSLDTLHLYNYTGKEGYFYSYKFQLDVNNNTFVVIDKDIYFGKFVYENSFIFFDGYGKGHISYDSTSYKTTTFAYNPQGTKINLEYINLKPNEKAGGAVLSMDTFGNIVTADSISEGKFEGKSYVNQYISRGAIVTFSGNMVGAGTDAVAKAKLYSFISIKTKDGEMSDSDKQNAVNTKTVRFSRAGFYQYTITLDIDGEAYTSYYALQVLEKIGDNPIVASYGSGLNMLGTRLTIDEYGQINLTVDGVTYTGIMSVDSNYNFGATIRNENKTALLSGYMVEKGLVYITVSGGISFADYYTSGSVNVSGVGTTILRRFVLSEKVVYMLFKSLSGKGEKVNVTALDGSTDVMTLGGLVEIASPNSTIYCRIDSWDSSAKGMTLSDGYRGTYIQDKNILFIDGFDKATLNGEGGSYTLNGRKQVVFEKESTTRIFTIDTANHSMTELTVPLDNSLVQGYNYSATYTFSMGGYDNYEATTLFSFKRDGRVVCTSVSKEYDESDTNTKTYSASFGNPDGVTGSYSVSGTKITIEIGGETIVFAITDVTDVKRIVCYTTTLSSNEEGYFATSTVFERTNQ